jgi:hypothetical protein
MIIGMIKAHPTDNRMARRAMKPAAAALRRQTADAADDLAGPPAGPPLDASTLRGRGRAEIGLVWGHSMGMELSSQVSPLQTGLVLYAAHELPADGTLLIGAVERVRKQIDGLQLILDSDELQAKTAIITAEDDAKSSVSSSLAPIVPSVTKGEATAVIGNCFATRSKLNAATIVLGMKAARDKSARIVDRIARPKLQKA